MGCTTRGAVNDGETGGKNSALRISAARNSLPHLISTCFVVWQVNASLVVGNKNSEHIIPTLNEREESFGNTYPICFTGVWGFDTS
jgi:hypothetical protein